MEDEVPISFSKIGASMKIEKLIFKKEDKKKVEEMIEKIITAKDEDLPKLKEQIIYLMINPILKYEGLRTFNLVCRWIYYVEKYNDVIILKEELHNFLRNPELDVADKIYRKMFDMTYEREYKDWKEKEAKP